MSFDLACFMVTFIVYNLFIVRNLNNGNSGEKNRLCLLGSSGGDPCLLKITLQCSAGKKILGTTGLHYSVAARGVSFHKRIKTTHRNRLLNEILFALLNISINHALVGDAEVQTAAQKWSGWKERRTLSKRGIKNLYGLESRRVERENKNGLPADEQSTM